MSLLSIAEAVNDLARLLEAKGLKHPRHAQHVAPARKRIKAVMVHFFERQRKVVLKDLKSRIDKELRLYPPPVAIKEAEAWEHEERVPAGEPGAGEWTSGGGEFEDPDEHPWRSKNPEPTEKSEPKSEPRTEQKEKSEHEKAVSSIRDEIEKEEFQHYGIRVMGDTKEGSTLKRSHVWADGEPTGKLLPGTSAVEVTRSHISDRIEKMATYEGQGTKLVLLGSNKITDGQDAHEIVMNKATVLKVFDFAKIRTKEALHPPPLKATERRIAEDSARANGGGLATAPLREAISPQGKTFARNLLPSSLQPLTFAATRAEENEYNDAITTLIGAAAKSLSASAAAAEDFAGDYLRSNSLSKLTGGLNSTSIERLQDALAGAWDGGGSYTEMVKAITDTFDDFSTKRAERIAQTEANDAYNGGRAQIAADLGMDEKKWDPDGEACPTCQANADAGWIDIGDDFPSGDDAPTAHPNCDCGTDYRKSSE